MKPALLVVDVQKRFFEIDPTTTRSLEDAIETINAAIGFFRQNRLPVIAVQHVDPSAGLTPGAELFDLPDSLCVEPGDLHIHKTYGNAFNKTSLEDNLRALGVDTVIVSGFCAEYCVLSAYRGAEDRDFAAILLRGGSASGTPAHIQLVESICEVVSVGALKTLLS